MANPDVVRSPLRAGSSRFLFGAYQNPTRPPSTRPPSPPFRPPPDPHVPHESVALGAPELDTQGELRLVSAFAELPREAIAELATQGALRREIAGAVLCAQGSTATRIEILLRGALKLVRTTDHGLGQTTVVLDVARGPALVPTLSFFDGQPELASAVSLRAAHVLSIDRRVVLGMVARHGAFGRALFAHLSQAARRHVRRIDEVASGPVDDRVRHLLEDLAAQHGTSFGQGRFIAIPLRRRDIACMVNATTETVSRVLARFEREGLTRSTRDGIWLRGAASPMRPSQPPASGEYSSGDALASSSRGAR